ncbi:SIR2 family protein [Pseudomonas lini]|uniref:SIR2-like domain-containing protein n=1 Tax=Pseudomonas lini TaxID=163011 RepID=A0A0J6HH50_9PSED|nr:SIR2 family protein [Pseudomonas lini]KAB0498265.1 hypothetical protein F7R14_27385 [Pseudomonas lini]KMM93569.1 hypothetical protein TU81_11815 [Pseudomonas lini]SDT55109.1 SIR2-like domain-containing protein [Pseudomonas lini]
MSVISGDPATRLAFSMHENKGVYAVLIGSGLSRSAGIPTGWEITMELIKRAGIASGVLDQEDWHAWYVERTGNQPNYSTLLEELATTQTERRAIIQGFLEPTEQELEDGMKMPTPAHRAIAEMVKAGFIRVIITTNFDRLMENALRELGIEPTVVSSVDTLAGAEPITHTQCYILKIHGDYKDARILNTDVELGDYPSEFNVVLDRILDEFGLIVSGWSGDWDHALRSAFTRAPNRRYPTFWVTRGRLSERGDELVMQRKAIVANASDADSFFCSLQLKLQTLSEYHQQNPASMELTIAMAKRFLSKPDHNIQLDDLVTTELRKLADHYSPIFADPGAVMGQDYATWITNYETSTETMARLSGVLGRWGNGAEKDLVLDAIRVLTAEALKNGSGLNVWLELKKYPAVLIFVAYGLGLTRAGRLKELYSLLESTIAIDSRITMSMGESFNLGYFESVTQKSIWQSLPGQDQMKTPLSNRLAEEVTPRWASSFAGLGDPVMLFDRFEFYCALYFTKTRNVTESSIQEHIERGQAKHIITGRSGWKRETISTIEEEMSHDEFRTPLLEAGFAYGSQKFLELFFACLRQSAQRF